MWNGGVDGGWGLFGSASWLWGFGPGVLERARCVDILC
jgi:hypothetical protein